MIGLYGTMAFVVATRTSEIGVRMAMVRPPRRILRGVLTQGVKLVGVGIARSVPPFRWRRRNWRWGCWPA